MMYICSNCREYKGIEKCLVCGTLYCFYCDFDDNMGLHQPEDHKLIYDLYEWADAIKKNN